MAVFSELCRYFRMGKQKPNLISGTFHGVGQQAGVFMNNLRRDATNCGSHHGLFLPKRFGHCKAKSFAQALLHNDGRSPLKRIDLERGPRGEFEDFDVRIVSCFTQYFFQNESAFGIIGSTAAREHQLTIEVSLHDSVSADHTDGIFQAVEAGYLRQYWPRSINLVT